MNSAQLSWFTYLFQAGFFQQPMALLMWQLILQSLATPSVASSPLVAVEQLVTANTVRFSQDAPLTSWRADNGSGLVTFGLQTGAMVQIKRRHLS